MPSQGSAKAIAYLILIVYWRDLQDRQELCYSRLVVAIEECCTLRLSHRLKGAFAGADDLQEALAQARMGKVVKDKAEAVAG